ncbi:MAG: site-2 protease family protein [Nitrosopumilaceae archaeon]|nr:site-2 protease family protein [Nitrosopumilaceae archaeon]
MAWVAVLGTAKALKLERRGVELKFYSLVYKNPGVQDVLVRILGRTRRGIRVFADVSVVAGFLMMGFAFWFLLDNVAKYFVEPQDFAELTVLIPGVTLTSAHSIAYFLMSIPIVLVMHEGAHGIVAALERIRIKNGGFAIFVAMFAGFVEPDEEEFNRARKISRLRVIGAGATSNVLFAAALGALLLTNPVFALVLPEPILGVFYESPEGVMVLSVMEGMGAEAAGIMAGDIITGVGGTEILRPEHFADLGLASGETVSVSILRDGIPMEFVVDVMESPDEPGRGLIGILRDNAFSYKPVLDFIQWGDPSLSLFLLWLWMISFFIGIINMLPLPILDGGKFIHTIIEGRMAERTVTTVMYTVYALTFVLFALNIALSYAKSGWFTI